MIKKISANIKRIRLEKGISLKHLSSLTKISKSILKGIENFSYDVNIKTLNIIATNLNVKVVDLLSSPPKKRKSDFIVNEQGEPHVIRIVNIDKTNKVDIHYRMNPTVAKLYKRDTWIIAVYNGIELLEIYKLTPKQLNPFYLKWNQKWKADGGKDINNPKIPLSFVKARGRLIYKPK